MALTDITIDFNVHQILGADFDARRTKAYIVTNVENQTLMDTSTGETRIGDQSVTINDDGTGSFTTWAVGADGNPVTWQTYLVLDYPRTGQRDRKTRMFGPWTLTTADDGKNITELEVEQVAPPEFVTALTAALRAIADEAQDSADAAAASAAQAAALIVTDLGTSDGQLSTLLSNPSLSRDAGDARWAKKVGGVLTSAATNDGTDQAAVINAELSSLSAFGGGVLQLRVAPSTSPIVVGTDLLPAANTVLRGTGKDGTYIKAKSTHTGRGVHVLNTPNVTIEDLTIDMNKAATTDGGSVSGQQGIYFHASNSTGCPGARVRRVRVQNSWYRGVEAKADTLTTHPLDATVDELESRDNGTNATGTGAYGINLENLTHAYMRRGRIERNGGYGIRVANCLKAAVDDNFVDDHQNNHGIVVNNATLDMSVCRNRVFRSAHAGGTGQTQWGIVIGISAAKFVVADNLCDGNEGGMTIDVATTNPAEFINTTGVVANNVLINCTRTNAALNVNRVDGLVISGNECAYSNQHGMSITARHCSVVGNHVHHNQQRGVEFLESGTGCGPHFFGPNYLHDNNLGGGSWKDVYSDTLTNGSVDFAYSGITASSESDTTVDGTAANSGAATFGTVVQLATSTNPPPQPGDRLLLRYSGKFINNTAGAQTVKFRYMLGSTVVAESNAASFSAGGTTPRVFFGEVVIAVVSTTSQRVSGQIIGFGSSSGMVIGTGGAYGALTGTASENLASSKDVKVLVQMGVNDANVSVTITSASLERIPRRR